MPENDRQLINDASSLELLAHTLSLAELLAGARDGRRVYIGELQRRFGPGLLRRMEAEDSTVTASALVDDVFMKLPTALRSYSEQGKFEAWLWVLARNVLTDHRRRRKSLPEPVEDEQLQDSGAASARPGLSFERSDLIERLTSSLAPRQREAFLLHLQGFSDKDTAARLGIEANAVAQLLHRARQRVREEAEAMGLRRSDIISSGLDIGFL